MKLDCDHIWAHIARTYVYVFENMEINKFSRDLDGAA